MMLIALDFYLWKIYKEKMRDYNEITDEIKIV